MQYLAEENGGALMSVSRFVFLVTSHKDVDVPDALSLQPIQVGPDKNTSYAFANMLVMIWETIFPRKNPMYCEMTTQYWAWKNIHDAEYGLCALSSLL